MITADRLTKYYGTILGISEVSFQIDKGEIVGFLGPNAAGKTTTLRILAGCLTPTTGTAALAGFDIIKHPLDAKRCLGYLPENIVMYPEMTVQGFLRYVAEVKGVPVRQLRSEIDRVLEKCGITHMKKRQIGHLSKGYRQRVGLAQALIGSPPVLILDEPTVGLDPQQIVEIRNLIAGLAGEHTILLSSHILPEVSMICKRVMIIHQGRLLTQDALKELGRKPGYATYRIEIMGDPTITQHVLRQLSGVVSINPVSAAYPENHAFEVEMDEGQISRTELLKILNSRGLLVCAFEEKRGSLEEIFIKAIAMDREQYFSVEGER